MDSQKEPEDEAPVVQEWKTEKVRDSRRAGNRSSKEYESEQKGRVGRSERTGDSLDIPSDIADILEEPKE